MMASKGILVDDVCIIKQVKIKLKELHQLTICCIPVPGVDTKSFLTAMPTAQQGCINKKNATEQYPHCPLQNQLALVWNLLPLNSINYYINFTRRTPHSALPLYTTVLQSRHSPITKSEATHVFLGA